MSRSAVYCHALASAGALSANDRLAVIDYIRANFGDFPKDTPEQLEAMNKKYHLEEVGEKSSAPTQITLGEAMAQIPGHV